MGISRGKTLLNKKKKDLEDEDEEQKEIPSKRFENLFTYKCEETDGMNISSIDINSLNKDLLVATYGGFSVENPQGGKICLWTLKSPNYPERIIETPTRITACKFSSLNPNLVAIGDYDGIISIYDIRSKSDKP